ncbi:hypothetical protein [Lentibacillus sp. CBA3610]|uniref:hypothetical protein n=1 Tax=Lentibacillus sp. CBA3610 TaxID=2518176 RepID=UPI00159614F8|nr:hypothetical protein [Lentibacillus sp. CBA3610]QKY68715.1 hypothetical protein Len3610_02940 [Lentibacillus sp. CBA3610]
MFEGSIALDTEEDHKLKPTSFGAGSTPEEDMERLSSIIERLNDRFGTEFTDTNRLSYEQVKEDIVNNEDLAQKAKVNTKDNFKFSYEEAFLDIVIDRMSQNENFFMKMMEDSDFKATVMNAMFDEIYHEMTGE